MLSRFDGLWRCSSIPTHKHTEKHAILSFTTPSSPPTRSGASRYMSHGKVNALPTTTTTTLPSPATFLPQHILGHSLTHTHNSQIGHSRLAMIKSADRFGHPPQTRPVSAWRRSIINTARTNFHNEYRDAISPQRHARITRPEDLVCVCAVQDGGDFSRIWL